jgi:hypothetical protein
MGRVWADVRMDRLDKGLSRDVMVDVRYGYAVMVVVY